jgi:hypothetical protein
LYINANLGCNGWLQDWGCEGCNFCQKYCGQNLNILSKF